MPGERWHLSGGVWRRVGWAGVAPGGVPVDPSQPPPPPPSARLRITDLSLLGTGTLPGGGGGFEPPPVVVGAGTYFGACPENPGGTSLADAQRVVTKFGGNPSIRQFHSDTAITAPPRHPTAASIVHTSYRPSDSQVNSGALDAQIEALVAACPDGDILEFKHESDNDGLDAAGRTARIAMKNRLYDIKQTVKPGVLVAHTATGGMWASYGSDSVRDSWMLTARADLIGLDADGIHDGTGPTYDTSYADEVANVLRYLAKSTLKGHGFIGWTVPEHGTSRQPWDTTGTPRANWFNRECQRFSDGGAYAVMIYDYDTGAHNLANDYNRVKVGTPEFTAVRNLIASNPS